MSSLGATSKRYYVFLRVVVHSFFFFNKIKLEDGRTLYNIGFYSSSLKTYNTKKNNNNKKRK